MLYPDDPGIQFGNAKDLRKIFENYNSNYKYPIFFYFGSNKTALGNIGWPRNQTTGLWRAVAPYQFQNTFRICNRGFCNVTISELSPRFRDLNDPNDFFNIIRESNQTNGYHAPFSAAFFFKDIDFENYKLRYSIIGPNIGPFYYGESPSTIRTLYSSMFASEFVKRISNDQVNYRKSTATPIYKFEFKLTFEKDIFRLFHSGIPFFAFLIISPLPLLLYSIMIEKTQGTKEMMKLMGMKMIVYWFQMNIWNLINYLLVIIIGIIIGIIFKWEFIYNSK